MKTQKTTLHPIMKVLAERGGTQLQIHKNRLVCTPQGFQELMEKYLPKGDAPTLSKVYRIARTLRPQDIPGCKAFDAWALADALVNAPGPGKPIQSGVTIHLEKTWKLQIRDDKTTIHDVETTGETQDEAIANALTTLKSYGAPLDGFTEADVVGIESGTRVKGYSK